MNAGLIKETVKQETTAKIENDFVPVNRGRTLSSLRSRAEKYYSDKHKTLMAVPATVSELTEAERIFQDSLKDTKDANVQ